jgi:hypothetical protein
MSPHRLAVLGVVATSFFACASEPMPGPESIPAPTAVTAPQSAATEIFRCGPTDPQRGGAGSVVTIDRGCATDADCSWGHEPVCCGPLRAFGVRKGDEKKLEGCAGCPPAACQIGPLNTEDDGHSADFPAGSDVLVSCVAGVCRTRLRK